MIVLGVSFLSDASAAVLRDGEVVAAVSQERLNRIKLWNGVPFQAIDEALRLAGITMDAVDVIATHGKAPPVPDAEPYERKEAAIRKAGLPKAVEEAQVEALRSRREHEAVVLASRTPAYLAELKVYNKPMKIYGHHEGHAACAYYGAGWDECMVLTADGWGEDGSSTVWQGATTGMVRIARTPSIDSLGYFYGSVTKALGFIPHRHEGKVLGLAAYCQDPRTYPVLRRMVDFDAAAKTFIGRMENGVYLPRFDNSALAQLIAGCGREDVAAATQRTLEEVVCGLVASLGTKARRLAVAGGIFANVKLNQRLAELPEVEEVFVFPNMGDGGLSMGVAWLAHAELTGCRPQPLRTMYLGTDLTDTDIGTALQRSSLVRQNLPNIADAVGELLAKNNVVARAQGRMEFGPRALGNRSILFNAVDQSVNKWLNEQLNRSEFMPFAPATQIEDAEACYINLDAGRQAARYMAMTFDCTPKMRAEAPAAVHVDGTARPQLVSREDNPDFHAIIGAYRQRTGFSSVINTSYNMHEEPIVWSANDAIRAFVESGIPYLALGNFLVTREEAVL